MNNDDEKEKLEKLINVVSWAMMMCFIIGFLVGCIVGHATK